jgi:hypothetical protein
MNAAGLSCRQSFSPRVWNKVAMEQTQERLRDAFVRWGLPLALRLDNGFPWGNWSELPTALALWVVGLGVGLKFNPPRRPRDNGVVERSHGVSKTWAEVATCRSAAELQERIDDLDKIQREEYPVFKSKSRWVLFPSLASNPRPYSREWEEANWQEQRTREYLAEQVARRKVDKQGKVKVYARSYYVGILHQHRPCCVQYNPDGGEWIFSDENGVQWCRQPAEQITAARIRTLDVSAKPSRNHGKTSIPN